MITRLPSRGTLPYSSLVSLTDREIGRLCERGEKGRQEQIPFARLALP